MSRTPMPSPYGTNRAGLYLEPGSRAAVAHDAMPGEPEDDDAPQDYRAVIEFLSDKLERADLVKVCRMLGLDDEAAGGSAEDRRRRAFRGASDHRPKIAIEPVLYDDKNFPHRNRQK